jgi:large subunit ribosomal protein L25
MPTLIEAQTRIPEGKNANRRIRQAGKIPAVIYGSGMDPEALSVDPGAIRAILRTETGQNTIFTVNVEGGQQHSAMVKDYQLDPVKGKLTHVDLMKIAMDRLLILTVNVELVGEPLGVKIDGGSLDFITRAIEIECMPADIPELIKLEVGALRVNEYIRAKDLNMGDKVRILTEPEVVIATVAPPKADAAAATASAAAEPEVIKKGKPEEK